MFSEYLSLQFTHSEKYVHQNSTVLASNLKRTQWGFKVAFRFLKVTSESASISVIYLLSLLEETVNKIQKSKLRKIFNAPPLQKIVGTYLLTFQIY